MNTQPLDFLDIAKGITILWVVWMHMEMPMHIWACFQMPFFFFISGSLYKQPTIDKAKEWLKRKAFSLLVPALTFSFISLILILSTLGKVNGSNIFWKLHTVCQASIVWFLQAMFVYQCIHYAINRWLRKKYLGIILSLMLYSIGYFLYGKGYSDIIPCLPVAHILVFWIYFEFGCLYGRNYTIIIKQIKVKQKIYFAILSIIFVIIVCTPILNEFCFRSFFRGQNYLVPIYSMVFNLCMIYLIIFFSYTIKSYRISNIWKYYGKNSLVVYLTHWPIYCYLIKSFINAGLNKYIGFIFVILIVTICIFFFNKYCPILIGKKSNEQ